MIKIVRGLEIEGNIFNLINKIYKIWTDIISNDEDWMLDLWDWDHRKDVCSHHDTAYKYQLHFSILTTDTSKLKI